VEVKQTYYEKNRETILQKKKEEYASDPQKFKDRKKKFYAEHPERREARLLYRRKWRLAHKDDVNAYLREYSKKNKDKRRAYKLRINFNLTPFQFEVMKEKQNGLCAICHKDKLLKVDHRHSTGKIRELLCGGCNTGLGLFCEDINILSSAIAYLEKHNKE
jgi:hypothetical protein